LQPLLDALQFSPDNLPLRQHLGELLRRAGRHPEAETLYRGGLRLTPGTPALQLGLAETYAAPRKTSAAPVVLEELLAAGPTYLLAEEQPGPAGEAYQQALRLDPHLADTALATELQAAAPGQPVPAGAAGARKTKNNLR